MGWRRWVLASGGVSKAGVGVPVRYAPTSSTLLLTGMKEQELLFRCFHCTLMLTVAVLLAMFGSGVFDIVAAFSVITVPAGAVTFTVRRTVHVVFGAMLLFS